MKRCAAILSGFEDSRALHGREEMGGFFPEGRSSMPLKDVEAGCSDGPRCGLGQGKRGRHGAESWRGRDILWIPLDLFCKDLLGRLLNQIRGDGCAVSFGDELGCGGGAGHQPSEAADSPALMGGVEGVAGGLDPFVEACPL